MDNTHLIKGLLCLFIGIAILWKNAKTIKTDLKDDTFGSSIKLYGAAVLGIVIGIYMLFFAK